MADETAKRTDFLDEIREVSSKRLVPNDWNPNHISKRLYEKLKRNIASSGKMPPLVVRPHPTRRGFFQIIDGYHRFRIAEELGWEMVPALVWDVTDEQARILTINLNYLRGSAKPKEYARLLHDLTEKFDLDELEKVLPDSKPKMLDSLELLKLPDGLEDELERQAAAQEKEALQTVQFQVTTEQKSVIEAAIEATGKKRRGEALAEVVAAGLKVLEEGRA